MTLEEIRNICLSLNDVTEDIKWGHDICFSISSKMFLVTSAENSPVNASFKVKDDEFAELIEREGFIPAPYLARHKWVLVNDINTMTKKEWKERITRSYELVKAKLPKERKASNIKTKK